MESQPQNPEFRNNPDNFHPCKQARIKSLAQGHNTVPLSRLEPGTSLYEVEHHYIEKLHPFQTNKKNMPLLSWTMFGQNFFISWFTNPLTVTFRKAEKKIYDKNIFLRFCCVFLRVTLLKAIVRGELKYLKIDLMFFIKHVVSVK